MFYEFRQNNSGGRFVRNNSVDHYVIIEADSLPQLKARALSIGIYFNGVAEGVDCGCCGARWYESDPPNKVPSHYDSPLTLANSSTKKNPREHTVVIHYLSGRIIYTTPDCENQKLNSRDWLALKNKDDSE